jgi:hypothetical protein
MPTNLMYQVLLCNVMIRCYLHDGVNIYILLFHHEGRRGRDRMLVGFTTTYVIS